MHIPGYPSEGQNISGFRSQKYMDKSQVIQPQAPDSLSSRGEKAKAQVFAQGSARGGAGPALIHLYCPEECFNFISELNAISTYTGMPASSQGGRSSNEDDPK